MNGQQFEWQLTRVHKKHVCYRKLQVQFVARYGAIIGPIDNKRRGLTKS